MQQLYIIAFGLKRDSVLRMKKKSLIFWFFSRNLRRSGIGMLIAELRMFLAGHSVAMVTYCVTKIIPTCLRMIGLVFDTMTVASIDKECLL